MKNQWIFWVTCMGICAGLFAQEKNIPQYQQQFGQAYDAPVEAWHFFADDRFYAQQKSGLRTANTTYQFLEKGKTLVETSARGNYVGVVNHQSGESQQNGTFSLTVLNNQLQPQMTITKTAYYDAYLPFPSISDKGQVVLSQAEICQLSFYDAQGKLVKEVQPFPNASHDYERNMATAFSTNSNYFTVAVLEHGASIGSADVNRISGNPALFLYDAKGNQHWKKALPFHTISTVAIADDGQMIAVSGYSVNPGEPWLFETAFYTNSGEMMFKTPYRFKTLTFNAGYSHALLIHPRKTALINLSTQKMVWENTEANHPEMFTNGKLSADGKTAYLLTAKSVFKEASGFTFTMPALLIVDAEGKRQQQVDFPYQTFKKTNLWLGNNGAKIRFGGSHQTINLNQN